MADDPQQQFYGQQQLHTLKSDYASIAFVCTQLVNKLATIMLVQVKSVSNEGSVSPVGTVSVQPLVNQLSGDGKAEPHATIFNVPYLRMQGGANAIILDPQVGDIGLCAFAMRDISAVKKDPQAAIRSGGANPGSLRKYDWADGLYIGGFLNGVPTQYVQFSADGVKIHSPTKIRLEAPTVEIAAGTSVTIDSPLNDIKGGGTKVDNKVFLTHAHTGVLPGGGTSGPVS